ncbi:MAG TPA: hypothetical protein VMB05_16185 [Solirubrobacteraceae bacterium]|nr:hypothetical protein [Solirubrobacteraceae bacterium]
MSAGEATHPPGTGSPSPSPERLASEQAERRVTLALFSAIFVLAAIGVTISVIANSVMHHHRAGMMGASRAVASAERVSLYLAPSSKPGPGGERYDAFSKTNFTVKVGQPVQMTIDNRDDVVHSITSTAAGVSIVVMPGTHTYTLLVRKAGRFKWVCAYPCDPFSMGHLGYMQGYITAT